VKNLHSIRLNHTQIGWIMCGILLLCFLLHGEVMSLDIQGRHAWRQTQTMWNIKNFVEQDVNILNPRVSHYNFGHTNIYRYEFPIMQWSIAMVQRLLGQNIIIVRMLSFLIAAWGAIGFYRLLRTIDFDPIPALSGFLFYLFAPVVFYYMINPMPDNLALAASMWYLHSIVSYQNKNKKKYLITAAFCLLLATLAKLPFLMVSVVSIFFFCKAYLYKERNWKEPLRDAATQLLIIAPALVWYYYVMPGWKGNGVLTGIFGMEVDWARNIDILKYHANTMFPQFLLYAPVWILFFIGTFYSLRRFKNNGWIWVLIGITFTYLLLQWSVIGMVHDYYLFPFLPWLYLFVVNGVDRLYSLKRKVWDAFVMLSIIAAPIVSYHVSMDKWYSVWYNADLYDHRDALTAAVPDGEKCIMLNDMSKYVFAYQVNKQGYIYNNDLSAPVMKDLIENHGIAYLYSDSRKFEEQEAVKSMLDSLLLDTGSIHVYHLKSE